MALDLNYFKVTINSLLFYVFIIFSLSYPFFSTKVAFASDMLAPYKSICVDIGFTEGSTEFGKCVLELRRREKSSAATVENTELVQKIEEANQQMEKILEQARLERERALKQQEILEANERQRQLGKALIDFGLGMASGQQRSNNQLNQSPGIGVPSFLVNQNTNALSRFCYYSGGGGTKVLTIGITALCPLQY